MRELQDLLIISVLMLALVAMLNVIVVLDRNTVLRTDPTDAALFAPVPMMPPTGDNQ